MDLTANSDEFGYETKVERNLPLTRGKLKQKISLDNSDISLSSTELELLESISIPPSLLPSKHKTTLNQKSKQQTDTHKFRNLVIKLYDRNNPNSYNYDKINLANIKDTNSPKSKYIKHLDRPYYRPGHRPEYRPWHRPEYRPGHGYGPGNKKPKESHAMKSDAKLKRFWFPEKPPRPTKWPRPTTRTSKRPRPEVPDLDFIPRPPPDDSNES